MRCVFLFLILLFPLSLFAQLKVARLFSDHLVLQRDKPIRIWGEHRPGVSVEVTLNGLSTTTTTGTDGRWKAELLPQPAGGPYMLTIKSQNETINLSDILIGEVWLCSGQSNMEWRVRQADNARAEIAAANYPQIRHFEVPHEMAFEPQKNLKSGEWQVCSPETAGEFTAAGYYFARELTQKLNVPIGLIHSSWGGSQVESWISEAAMSESEVLNYYPKIMARSWEEDARRWEEKLIKKVYGRPDFPIAAVDETAYLNENHDYSNWLKIKPNGQWDWQGVWAFRGGAYIQRYLDLPAEYVNQSTRIDFGLNTGDLMFYINGKKVFEGYRKNGVSVDIPPGAWRAGKNSLLIKMNAMRDPEWFGMGFMGPAQDFKVALDEKNSLPLLDVQWNMMPSWKEPRRYQPWMNNEGAILYNAMIAPLIPYPIAGVIWYQGESNTGRAWQYRQSFPLMIKNWRRDWGDEFPFLFVQLSSFGANQSSNEGSQWAELREAQAMTLQVPNTGMAVSLDIGNPDDIHPANKQDVGKRLALNALKIAYHQNVIHCGPFFKKAVFSGSKAEISMETSGGELVVKDKYGYLKGFEIAGADKKFYYATATIEGSKITVSHPKVPDPKAVRYGWADAPTDCNLYNAAGLPAEPFRTDDWEAVTRGIKFE